MNRNTNSVLDDTPEELRQAFAREGLERFRADQVLRWVYGHRVRDFRTMSDLARPLRERLYET